MDLFALEISKPRDTCCVFTRFLQKHLVSRSYDTEIVHSFDEQHTHDFKEYWMSYGPAGLDDICHYTLLLKKEKGEDQRTLCHYLFYFITSVLLCLC